MDLNGMVVQSHELVDRIHEEAAADNQNAGAALDRGAAVPYGGGDPDWGAASPNDAPFAPNGGPDPNGDAPVDDGGYSDGGARVPLGASPVRNGSDAFDVDGLRRGLEESTVGSSEDDSIGGDPDTMRTPQSSPLAGSGRSSDSVESEETSQGETDSTGQDYPSSGDEGEAEWGDSDEETNASTTAMEEAASTPLFAGSAHSRLGATYVFLSGGKLHNCSDTYMDELFRALSSTILPQPNTLPCTYREALDYLRRLGHSYKSYDACPNNCVL